MTPAITYLDGRHSEDHRALAETHQSEPHLLDKRRQDEPEPPWARSTRATAGLLLAFAWMTGTRLDQITPWIRSTKAKPHPRAPIGLPGQAAPGRTGTMATSHQPISMAIAVISASEAHASATTPTL